MACLTCNRQAREQSTACLAESRRLHTGNRFPGVGDGKKSVPGDRAYPFVQQCFVSGQSEHTHGALSLVVSVASGNTTLARHHGVSRAASQHSSGHRTRRAQKHVARYSLAPTTTMKGRQLDDQCSALKAVKFLLLIHPSLPRFLGEAKIAIIRIVFRETGVLLTESRPSPRRPNCAVPSTAG